MTENQIADLWIDVLRQEESALCRLIEVLQEDQEAIAHARADRLEENLRRKEVLVDEIKVIEESKAGLAKSIGIPVVNGSILAESILSRISGGKREDARKAIDRVRALHSALKELNEVTKRIMLHGLFIVRSAIGSLKGETVPASYGDKGDQRQANQSGRLLRASA